MADTKVTAAGAIGAGAGVAQTLLLREYVDREYPTTNIPSLKGFGYMSPLLGLIGGGTALAIGAVGASKGRDGRQRLSDIAIEPAIDYGAAALVGGILSGLKPAVTEADCVAKGGYWYDGVCHKTPPAGVTSMQGAPKVQTAAYRPPASVQQPSLDVMRQMSAEIQKMHGELQRLAAENSQLRTAVQQQPAIEVSQILPGPVKRRQEEYGFMAGPNAEVQQPLVTKRTEQIRKKFDFMG